MSMRTLVEINHDYVPKNEDLRDWAYQIAQYMRSGDKKYLPDGVIWIEMKHHSDPGLVSKGRPFSKEELENLFVAVDYTINNADEERPVDADLAQLLALRKKLRELKTE
jgi:hypothetical protein